MREAWRQAHDHDSRQKQFKQFIQQKNVIMLLSRNASARKRLRGHLHAEVVRNDFGPRLFSMKGAVTMSLVTKQSPMNLESHNDTNTGIDALSRTGLDSALNLLLGGMESLGGRLPGP
ncbi:hypothetical protein [Cystobacter ferrugineus]|uniref:Uncharacterized protein n=1 Tax=Cystobacter ferrugineus TaxID=83449 RepID=A0A1L9B6F0_9BACT|nr:hypothetical protein [Cystobacter ferrugineus]OJH37800.1 hypothetical protein BON30_26845 [Cystobacter ferrugineus]